MSVGPSIVTVEPVQARESGRLVEEVDELRSLAFNDAFPGRRSELGQFSTPLKIATRMAAMFEQPRPRVRLLDAGAGVGSLAAAYVSRLCSQRQRPSRLDVTAFEIDPDFVQQLSRTLAKCGNVCADAKIGFDGRIRREDFIAAAVTMIDGGFFGGCEKFDCAILNPPYKKIAADSVHRSLLRRVGIETSNLYTAFLALVIMLLEPGGEMVAITPRSFCNGPYFKPFRQLLLREMSLRHIHVFESRKAAFSEDNVLQENIIFHAVKDGGRSHATSISTSTGPDDDAISMEVQPEELVKPGDPEQFIHIVSSEEDNAVSDLMATLSCSLAEIDLQVSTGRLVDFRSRDWLRPEPGSDTVPLIYPTHFSQGWVSWPKLGHKKPNACVLNDRSGKWLIPAAVHVLTKRFSAKEEKRRIVAAVFDPVKVPCDMVAFENHVNYFHDCGRGLPMRLAKGLTAFLNSTAVDSFFRQFNGHTQVNAADLRNLRYPTRLELEELGTSIGDVFPDQVDLDLLVQEGFSRWQRKRTCVRPNGRSKSRS